MRQKGVHLLIFLIIDFILKIPFLIHRISKGEGGHFMGIYMVGLAVLLLAIVLWGLWSEIEDRLSERSQKKGK